MAGVTQECPRAETRPVEEPQHPVQLAVVAPAPAAAPDALQKVGVRLILSKVQRRLWSTHTSVAVARDLMPSSHAPAEGIQFQLTEPEAFDDLPKLVEASDGIEFLFVRGIERLRQAHVGRIASARDDEGGLLAFHFVHERDNHEVLAQAAPGMYPQLPVDEVFTEAVYCLPAHRGRGITASLLQATCTTMTERGMTRARAYVDITNAAALRMFNRAGYHPLGDERIDRFRFGRFSTEFRALSPAVEAEWETILARPPKSSS
jgi:L-amino acid N-acyltransferase YncA